MLELDIADGEEDNYEFWLDFFGGPFPPILFPRFL
jgi:hypothetical protein